MGVNRRTMTLLLFLLWLRGAAAAIATTTADSSITCFQEDLKCVAMNDNLIRTYIGITWQECSLLCEDEIACETFNFFGENSDFHNACLLFSECENKIASEDCLLGTREPDCDCTSVKYCPCTIEYEGGTDSDNFVDLASEIENEGECKSLCLNTTDCAIFTYFDDQHPFQPNFCLLLKDAGYDKAITKCNHCKTGSATCQSGQKCQAAFLTDGTAEGLVVFAKADSSANLVSAERDCYMEVRALAIGGGGGGVSYHGGGGSGSPEVGLLQLRANETLDLIVGRATHTSSVEKDGQVILSAAAGQDYSGYNGGDGYSGGGAAYGSNMPHGQDGGFDGGDGGSYSSHTGGKGSGIVVSSLNMTRFVLTPGKAGLGHGSSGGGGGGILVNGEKPSGGNENQGEGFGGGGGRFNPNGLPGCVLIEV